MSSEEENGGYEMSKEDQIMQIFGSGDGVPG